MKKIVSGIWGAVTGLVVTVAYEQIFSEALQWPQSASLFASVALGIGLLLIYEVAIESKAFIRWSSPLAKMEGAWRITLTDNALRPTSICKIYLPKSEYVYKGYGIAADGRMASEWSSRDVHYDEAKEEFSFTADAMILPTGQRVRNYGYIKFFKNANGCYEYGDGYFVDMAETLHQTHMTLTRVSDQDFDASVKALFSPIGDASGVAERLSLAAGAT